MKKLYPFAVYALATAVTALGSGSVLAQNATSHDDAIEAQTQSAQRYQDDTHSASTPGTKPTPGNKPTTGAATGATTPNVNSSDRAKQAVSQTPAADRANKPDHARSQNRGYIDSAPVNGMQASDLIGAEVKTTGGENVGPVDDLIIDENGQVVAIVIGVGGFLNMGEKDVAIGWDDVTRTGTSDEPELRINVTRDDLRPAPEYAKQD